MAEWQHVSTDNEQTVNAPPHPMNSPATHLECWIDRDAK
jgi:hypothetical protein